MIGGQVLENDWQVRALVSQELQTDPLRKDPLPERRGIDLGAFLADVLEMRHHEAILELLEKSPDCRVLPWEQVGAKEVVWIEHHLKVPGWELRQEPCQALRGVDHMIDMPLQCQDRAMPLRDG